MSKMAVRVVGRRKRKPKNLLLKDANWYYRKFRFGKALPLLPLGAQAALSEAAAAKQVMILEGRVLEGRNVWLEYQNAQDALRGQIVSPSPPRAEPGSTELVSAARVSPETRQLGVIAPTVSAEPTVAAAVAGFQQAFGPQWRKGTRDTYAGMLKALNRQLGDRPVGAVTALDILSCLRAEYWDQDKVASGTAAVAQFRRIFAFAHSEGWCSGPNPVDWNLLKSSLRKPPETVNRRAVPEDALPGLYRRLMMEAANDGVCRLLALLCVLPARLRELSELPWEEIDTRRRLWSLPAGRSKTKSEWLIPLSDAALSLLGPARRGLVFADPHTGQRYPSWVVLERFRRFSDADIHGLRSSFSTWCYNQKLVQPDSGVKIPRFPEAAVEGCLCHVYGSKVQRAYNRSNDVEGRRDCLEAWGEFVTTIPRRRIQQTV